MRRISPTLALVVFAAVGSALPAIAQQNFLPTRPTHNPHNTYGSPLDTLKSSHLWTSVPRARDFVRDSRPSAGTLDYAPLTGTDPVRPKPRDSANVEALQAELEQAGVANEKRGRALRGGPSTTRSNRKRKASAD